MEGTITSPFVQMDRNDRRNTKTNYIDHYGNMKHASSKDRSRSRRDKEEDENGAGYRGDGHRGRSKKDKKHRSSSRGRDFVVKEAAPQKHSVVSSSSTQRTPALDTRGIPPPQRSPSALALGESARLAREGSASCVLGNELVVCGGAAAFGENPSDSLLLTSFRRLIKLNMLAAEWGHQDTFGEVPLPRTHHSICAVQGGSKLVLTGGELISPKVIAGPLAASPIQSTSMDQHYYQSASPSHLPVGRALVPPITTTMITSSYSPKSAPSLSYFELDVVTGEWKSFETFGDVPHNRSHHTTSACGSTVVLLGGKPVINNKSSSGREVVVSTASLVEMRDVGFFDVFVLHLSCRVWQRIETGRLDPSASPMLWGHSATNVGRQYIALYGGFDVSAGLPISGFSTDSKKSVITSSISTAPIAELSNDVFVLDTETMLWERVRSGIPPSNDGYDGSVASSSDISDENDHAPDQRQYRRDGKVNTETQTAAPSKPWATSITKPSSSPHAKEFSGSPSPATTHQPRGHRHEYRPYHSPQTPSFYHGAVREDAERVAALNLPTSTRRVAAGHDGNRVLQEMTKDGYLVNNTTNVPLWGPARQLNMDLGRAVAAPYYEHDEDRVDEGDALSNDYDDEDGDIISGGGGDGFEEEEGALAARAKRIRKATRYVDVEDSLSPLQPPPPSFGQSCLHIPNSEEIIVLGGWAVNPNCTFMLSSKERAKRHKKHQREKSDKARSSSSTPYIHTEEPLLRSLSDPYVFNLQTRQWRRIACPSSDTFSGDIVACVHGQHIIALKNSSMVFTLDCSPIPSAQGWQRYPSALSPDLQNVRIKGYESATSPATMTAEYYGHSNVGNGVSSPDSNQHNQSSPRRPFDGDDGKARDWGAFNVEAVTHGSRRPVDQSMMSGYRNPNLPLPAGHYHGEVVATPKSDANNTPARNGVSPLVDAEEGPSSFQSPSGGRARWPTTGPHTNHANTSSQQPDGVQLFIRAAFESPYRSSHNNNNVADAVEDDVVLVDEDEPDFSPFAPPRASRSVRGGSGTTHISHAPANYINTSATLPNRYVSPSSQEFVSVPPHTADSVRNFTTPTEPSYVVEGRLLDSPPHQKTAAPSPTNNHRHHHTHRSSSTTPGYNMPASTDNNEQLRASSSSSSVLSATPYSQRVQQRFNTTTATHEDAFGEMNHRKHRDRHSDRRRPSDRRNHPSGDKKKDLDTQHHHKHRSPSPSSKKQRVKDLRSHRDRLEELRGRLEETQRGGGKEGDGPVELPKDIAKILKQMKKDSRKVELLIEELEVTRGLERVTSRGERLNDRSRSRMASRSVSPYAAVGASGSGDNHPLHTTAAGSGRGVGGRIVDDEEAIASTSYPTGGMASPQREQYYTHALGAVPVGLRY